MAFTGCVMSSPKEYRDYAVECANNAAMAKDPRFKELLMETAKLWMQAALEVERSWALTSEDEPVKKRN